MNRRQTLARARLALAGADPEAPSLEAEVLLRHALGVSRVQLYQEFHKEMSPAEAAEYEKLVARRGRGEPVAYITGHQEFYGRDFDVDRWVLIPRPETELLVGAVIGLTQQYPVATVADIGTGCGAIAICLALNLPQVRIYVSDVSAGALEVAQLNARKHNVASQITFLEGDLLEPLPEPVDIIVSNPPYVTAAELEDQASFEPPEARDGGPDGLAIIRRLCHQLPGRLRGGGHLVMEIGHNQKEAVTGLLRQAFPGATIDVTPDLAGIDRVVCLTPEPAVVK